MRYQAHTWEMVRGWFAEASAQRPDLLPMRGLVERIAGSRYAAGLYPVLSMWTLRLYQAAEYDPARDPVIVVDYDSGRREFLVEYHAGPSGPPFSAAPLESRWTRRDADGFAALERCLWHLRWFNEYGPPTPGREA